MNDAHIARPTNISDEHPKKFALRVFVALAASLSSISTNENHEWFFARQVIENIAEMLRSVRDAGQTSKVRFNRAVRIDSSYFAYPNIPIKVWDSPKKQSGG